MDGEAWLTAVQAFMILAVFFGGIMVVGSFNFSRDVPPPVIVPSFFIPPTPDNRVAAAVQKPVEKPKPQQSPAPNIAEQQKADLALKKAKAEEEEKKRIAAEQERIAKEKERERIEKAAERERLAAAEAEQRRIEEEEEKKRAEKEREEILNLLTEEEEIKNIADARAAAEAAQAAREAAAATAELVRNNLLRRIKGKIEQSLRTPASVKKTDNLIVVIKIRLHADGTLINPPEVEESSGYEEYDRAALRAIINAVPLPMPKDKNLIKEFQEINLYIEPD